MTIKLTADDLRALAAFIDSLNTATKNTGVLACAYSPAGVQLPHWSHALEIDRDRVERYPDDPNPSEVYSLVVGSAQ